jgi:hypothetical protein
MNVLQHSKLDLTGGQQHRQRTVQRCQQTNIMYYGDIPYAAGTLGGQVLLTAAAAASAAIVSDAAVTVR